MIDWPLTGQPKKRECYCWRRRKKIVQDIIDLGRPDRTPYLHDNIEEILEPITNAYSRRAGGSLEWRLAERERCEAMMVEWMISVNRPVHAREISEACKILPNTVRRYLRDGIQFEEVEGPKKRGGLKWWRVIRTGERKQPKQRRTWRQGEALEQMLEWLEENGPATIKEMQAGLGWRYHKAQSIVQRRYGEYFEVAEYIPNPRGGNPTKVYRVASNGANAPLK